MDGINEILDEYLKSPDDLVKMALGWSAFPSIVLTLFLVHGFVTSWLELGKKAVAATGELGRIGGRLAGSPRGRVTATVLVTALVLALETAWVLAATVLGNILYFAYYVAPGDERNMFTLPPHEVFYRIDWLGYSHFSSIYVPILVVLLVSTAIWPVRVGNLGVWIANLPMVLLVVGTAFVVLIELVLDVGFGGAPISKYPELAWQGTFLGVAAVFALASLAAFSAVTGVRRQWTALVRKPVA